MATFGQGINPQLGATDYSAILRGAQAGAQMSAQGQSAIGQGLASLGQSIGEGVKKYFAEQEQNKTMIGEMMSMAQADPSLVNGIDPKKLEAFTKGKFKRGDLLETYAQVNTNMKMKQVAFAKFQQDQEMRKAAVSQEANQIVGMMDPKTGALPSVVDVRKFSPEARRLAVQMATQEQMQKAKLENMQSETAKNLAGPVRDPLQQRALELSNRQKEIEIANAGQLTAIQKVEVARNERLDNEKTVELQDKQAKVAAAKNEVRAGLEATLKTVNEAMALAKRGAGGPVAGLPLVRDFNAIYPYKGASDAKVLNSKYVTLKATQMLDNMAKLKALSPSGASGLGPQSDAEGRALAASLAELDTSLPEAVQLEHLRKIEASTMRLMAMASSNLSASAQKYLNQ